MLEPIPRLGTVWTLRHLAEGECTCDIDDFYYSVSHKHIIIGLASMFVHASIAMKRPEVGPCFMSSSVVAPAVAHVVVTAAPHRHSTVLPGVIGVRLCL